MSSAGLNPRLRDWRAGRLDRRRLVGHRPGDRRGAGGGRLRAWWCRRARPGRWRNFAARHAGALALPLDACAPGALAGAVPQCRRIWAGSIWRCTAPATTADARRPLDLEEALRHQDINVGGAWRLLDAVLPVLLVRGGHVSLVSSVAGYRGLPMALAFTGRPGGADQLAQSLWQDLRPRGWACRWSARAVATPLTASTPPMPALIARRRSRRARSLRGWARGEFEIHFPRFSRVRSCWAGSA